MLHTVTCKLQQDTFTVSLTFSFYTDMKLTQCDLLFCDYHNFDLARQNFDFLFFSFNVQNDEIKSQIYNTKSQNFEIKCQFF